MFVLPVGSLNDYPFWQDDHRAPDYARAVAIHHKPGYDPAEVSAYLTARIEGQKVARPKARSWRR